MSLLDAGASIARAARPSERIPYGPWKGSMRSRRADQVPPEYMAESDADTASSNFLYIPRSGTWKRRGGQTIQFDVTPSSVGLLPAKWSSKGRQIEEFTTDDVNSDGIPSVIALLTKETVATGLDDGRFSNVWLRDQLAGSNYTLGSEFSTTTYPVPGTEQAMKFVPVWYDSGEGGITRGVDEFHRRFFASGSRRFQKVGNWWYFPNFYGTPVRWRGTRAATSVAEQRTQPNRIDVGAGWGGWRTDGGAQTLWTAIDEWPFSDTDYIHQNSGSTVCQIGLTPATDPGVDTGHVYKFRYENVHASLPFTLTATLVNINASGTTLSTIYSTAIVVPALSGKVDFEVTLSTAEAATITNYALLGVTFNTGAVTNMRAYGVALELPGVSAGANRLFPTGPIPPTHAGTITKGNVTAGGVTTHLRPDADETDGSWTGQDAGTSLFSYIDETTADDADYIQCATGGAASRVRLGDPGFVPDSTTHTVQLQYRHSQSSTGAGAVATLTVQLQEDVASVFTTRAQSALQPTNGVWQLQSYQLTTAEIDAIADWTKLYIRFTVSGGSNKSGTVSYATLKIDPIQSSIGGWKGHDRFYYSMAYRFEDDSVWMPCTPRAPNAILMDGFNLFTVDADNPDVSYDKLTRGNLPIPPYGVKSKLILRTPKIDSTTDDNLQLDVYDLRFVAEVDAATTSYDDYFSDDDALAVDPSELRIRYDHRMPPRARYFFAGDSRACVSYGGDGPCAIELTPVGHTAAYDLNLADNDSTAYGSAHPFYYQLSSTTLTLYHDAASPTSNAIALAGLTLQNLVDTINATAIGDAGGMWRAQLLPGINSEALAASDLTPTTRAITSCVISGQSITRAAGGLSAVAVGAWIQGTGVTNGAYVSVINSDTQLTFVGTITPATVTLTFASSTGDTPAVADVYDGYVRVIANSLPGFLFFNKTYLDKTPLDKAAVWMTVASPGAVKSAPNAWSNKIDNVHRPPLEAGIAMGGAAVDNGFVVPFSKMSAVIRNTRDQGTGLDQDYKLFIMNSARGSCSWNSIAAGSRFAVYFSPDGLIACNLFNEVNLSLAIYDPDTGLGDFSYEGPTSIGGTAQDDDTAYLHAKIMQQAIWVTYRSASGHPNRMLKYDFSAGDAVGLEALVSKGEPLGWSVPLVHASGMSVLGEGRRDDGAHLYGWNESNAGSAGDGRIDEFETGSTDNTTAISGSITTPWFRFGSDKVSSQDIVIEHASPVGSTTALDFHRGYTDTTFSFTPTTSDTLPVVKDIKLLTMAARVVTDACYLGWRQSAGSASELRRLELRAKRFRSYK